MSENRFEATFVIHTDRSVSWERLTGTRLDPTDDRMRLWLPGFDSAATVTQSDEAERLVVTKDDEPCAGTDIVVTLSDAELGTRITVVQSGFGDWMPPLYDVMSVGWRHIIADLTTYLSTAVHGRRHNRPWGDLGADIEVEMGGLRIGAVRTATLANDLGLREDDLLLVLAGAPLSSHDDLITVLRVLADAPGEVAAEFVRDNALRTSTATIRR